MRRWLLLASALGCTEGGTDAVIDAAPEIAVDTAPDTPPDTPLDVADTAVADVQDADASTGCRPVATFSFTSTSDVALVCEATTSRPANTRSTSSPARTSPAGLRPAVAAATEPSSRSVGDDGALLALGGLY